VAITPSFTGADKPDGTAGEDGSGANSVLRKQAENTAASKTSNPIKVKPLRNSRRVSLLIQPYSFGISPSFYQYNRMAAQLQDR